MTRTSFIRRSLALAAALVCGPIAAGPALAARPQAQDLGATAAEAPQTISVYLRIRNVAQLERFIADSVDPGSSHYRRFLSVDEFRDRYGPRDIDLLRVLFELRRAGLHIDEIFDDHLVIRATGSTAQINRYFGTEVHEYSENGKRFKRPDRSVIVPDSIGDLVLGVGGLNTRSHVRPMIRRVADKTLATGDAQARAAQQRSSASASAGSATGMPINPPGELTVADVASLYNVGPLYKRGITGKRQTIGIATLAGFDPADAYAYWAQVGLNVSQHRITQTHVDGGGSTAAEDGTDETTLDVQQSGGMAPDAKLIVYDAPNTDFGFSDVFYKVASENKVDTLSVSWGQPEILNTPESTAALHQAFLELAAQGITVFASSGDAGAYDMNYLALYPECTKVLSVDSPSSDPYVVAAGGTTLPGPQVHKFATVTVPLERPWGWNYLQSYFDTYYADLGGYDVVAFPVGGGGGVSILFDRPDWQAHTQGVQVSAAGQTLRCAAGSTVADDFGLTLPLTLPAHYRGRNLPDVSLNADPYTGYLYYFQGEWGAAGGTSFVAPQLNGITALLAQSAGSRIGFLNPQLYARLAQYGYGSNSPFHAITYGDNLYWPATPSYNPASGIGTLDVDKLARSLR